MSGIESYESEAGRLVPVFRMEINTRPDDAERLLDAIVAVHPLAVGQYERNATVTAPGAETGRPGEQTVTRIHNEGFKAGGTTGAAHLKWCILAKHPPRVARQKGWRLPQSGLSQASDNR